MDHFPAERFDEDQRNSFNETAFLNAVHNETYAVLKHFGTCHRALYVLWVLIVGSKASPGIIQFLRLLPRERTAALKKYGWPIKADGMVGEHGEDLWNKRIGTASGP